MLLKTHVAAFSLFGSNISNQSALMLDILNLGENFNRLMLSFGVAAAAVNVTMRSQSTVNLLLMPTPDLDQHGACRQATMPWTVDRQNQMSSIGSVRRRQTGTVR
jgi:hypothetical protein